ncbi:hypothetical protein H2199_008757 [Coniosporium tulheliwenetii]|uniref:Uncharacterized protein n=1 Tax=Coniosporium tulheliwenetii TaxID=3383036 RepID=A0ACC2YHT7_9PEZI|nr:hypothetical protein H2199_008757 [Cladosporium sp. JES 115]
MLADPDDDFFRQTIDEWMEQQSSKDWQGQIYRWLSSTVKWGGIEVAVLAKAFYQLSRHDIEASDPAFINWRS